MILLSQQYLGSSSYPNSALVIYQAFGILEKCKPRNATEKRELDSLLSLKRLVEERRQRPLQIEQYAYSSLHHQSGMGMQGEDRSPVFPTHEFATAACEPTYCGIANARRFSVQSTASTEYPDSAMSPAVVPSNAWSISLASFSRCGSDVEHHGYPAHLPYDSYENELIRLSQGFAGCPGEEAFFS